MNILCIGDIVGGNGCEFLRSKLPALKRMKAIDVVIANGENASDGNGITPASAKYIFDSGVDIITLGNHSFRRPEIYDYLDEHDNIIRPANFPKGAPGVGYTVHDMGRHQVAVINLMGQVYIDALDCPFAKLDEILANKDLPKICIVDFHAEGTSEKRAMGFLLNGKASAVWGTHTHVQTSDACVLDGGTGYITDLGMTGPLNSVLGIDPEQSIGKFMGDPPRRYESAKGRCVMEGCIFEIDENSGRCIDVEAVRLR